MKKLALLSLLLLLFSFSAISILEAASAQPKRGGTITLGISKELALMNPLVNTSSTESRIRELMIFQEPMTSLNPSLTVGTQIGECYQVHLGHSKKVARDCTENVLAMVRLPTPKTLADRYPHALSRMGRSPIRT